MVLVEDVRLSVNQILTLFGGRVSSATGQVMFLCTLEKGIYFSLFICNK